MPIELVQNTPGLSSLILNGNQIVALPQSSNHIAAASDANEDNTLVCTQYGPTAKQCRCNESGYYLSLSSGSDDFCGYVRCTNTTNGGCPSEAIWDQHNCSLKQWSVCVTSNTDVTNEYYDTAFKTFTDLTVCNTTFPNPSRNGTFLRAYEAYSPRRNDRGIATSDRLCSICSNCPEGFDETPCVEPY